MKRYKYLDILSLFCAFLVICIHSSHKDSFSFCFEPFTKAAVPVFFMRSGFFFKSVCEQGKLEYQIKKLLKITLVWYVIYAIAEFGVGLGVGGADYVVYTQDNFLYEFLKFIFFNKPMLNLGGALWYMFAIGYVYFIFGLAYRVQKVDLLTKVGFVLLLLCCLIGPYSFVFGMATTIIRTRNYLFMGIPFFSLGIFFQEKLEYSLEANCKHSCLVTLRVVLFVLVLLSILEKYMLLQITGLEKTNSDIYISSMLVASCLFYYALAQEGKKENTFMDKLAQIGSKYGTSIYLIHPIIACLLDMILRQVLGVQEDNVLFYTFPIIIFFISLGCLMWYQRMVAMLCRRRGKNNDIT